MMVTKATKRETAQKLAPWAAIIVAILGTANAWIDARAAKRKAVYEAKDQAEESREWSEERAARAYRAVREKLVEGDRQRSDLYYRLSLVERDLDAAIELLGTPPPPSGVARRDYEAKLHALVIKERPTTKADKPPAAPAPTAPLSDWDAVQREAPIRLPVRPADSNN